MPLQTLTKRADFLKAAKSRKQVTPGFILQARQRLGDDSAMVRVGFTASKKVGNAVARNRAKRRLREIARLDLTNLGQPGFDYVLIGRAGATADAPFDQLRADLARALAKLHRARTA